MPEALRVIGNLVVVVIGIVVIIMMVWVLHIIAGFRLTYKEEVALKEIRDQKKNPLYLLKKTSS